MITPSYSLTDNYIIKPSIRLFTNSNPILKHIAARIVAIFASFVALLDICIHVLSAIHKIRTPRTGVIAGYHMKKAFFFARVALTASFLGVISPTLFTHVSSFADKHFTPIHVKRLSDLVKSSKEVSPFPRLASFLRFSSPLGKKSFVEAFSKDVEGFELVRFTFKEHVYKGMHSREVSWLSKGEIAQEFQFKTQIRSFDPQHPRYKAISRAFYFHCTKTKNDLYSIMTTSLEARQISGAFGAFVSTEPEISTYGKWVLAFKRKIERLAQVTIMKRGSSYWAGFHENIPVTKKTLAGVIISGSAQERDQLEKDCKSWTGRDIHILTYDEVKILLKQLKEMNMGVPIEW